MTTSQVTHGGDTEESINPVIFLETVQGFRHKALDRVIAELLINYLLTQSYFV